MKLVYIQPDFRIQYQLANESHINKDTLHMYSLQDVGTAGYLVMVLAHRLPVWALPSIVAVMGYIISFAAGSAFGTMGVMFPLTLPLGVSILHVCARKMYICNCTLVTRDGF